MESAMIIPEHRFSNKPIRHAQLLFASNASLNAALVAAPATGLANLMIYYRFGASAVASIGITNGSGGTTIWNSYTAIAQQFDGPWWDPQAHSPATSIHVVGANGIGSGFIDVWYITVMRGTGGDAAAL